MVLDPKNDDELIRDCFLCRKGGLLLVGPTGIGKSSFGMQAKILWAIGRESCGITPARPLRSILFQSENDKRDLIRMRDGVVKGLGLTPEEVAMAKQRIRIVTVSTKSGTDFAEFADAHLKAFPADLIWVDPALGFVGCDASSQESIGSFLRKSLQPILDKHNCGCVLIHHPNKPPMGQYGRGKIEPEDMAYYGSGSIEWANWSRAIITISRTAKVDVFKLQAAKKGERLKWVEQDGVTRRKTTFIKQSEDVDMIFWEETVPLDSEHSHKNGASAEAQIIALVPEEGSISRKDLVDLAKDHNIGRQKATAAIDLLVSKHRLFDWEIKRPNVRPEAHVGRTKQAVTTNRL